MRISILSYLVPAMGAAVALAGGDKLAGMGSYNGMFRHLGWSRGNMLAAAAAEMAGGVLMIPRSTRWIGGALVAAASAAVLTSEIRHGDTKLALPRGLVLLGGLTAMFDGIAASTAEPKPSVRSAAIVHAGG